MQNLFIIDIEGYELSTVEEGILLHTNVGGVILFTRNFKNIDQLKKLTGSIKEIRPDIFIAVDHEGGFIQRFKLGGFRAIPAPRVYGELYEINKKACAELVLKHSEIMCKQLQAVGIDVNLGPVLDLHRDDSKIIGSLDRAYHSHPVVVAKIASMTLAGMCRQGMPGVAKHFPGHGSVIEDSHTGKPTNNGTLNELLESDLLPFKILIQQEKLPAIMPAHVLYEAVDPENTAGFSKIWIKDILRDKLGFKGMIFSDCLSMKGADIGEIQRRAFKALRAGCDMVIVCNQSREFLIEILDSVLLAPSKEFNKRLDEFKLKIKRFNNEQHEEDPRVSTRKRLSM